MLSTQVLTLTSTLTYLRIVTLTLTLILISTADDDGKETFSQRAFELYFWSGALLCVLLVSLSTPHPDPNLNILAPTLTLTHTLALKVRCAHQPFHRPPPLPLARASVGHRSGGAPPLAGAI